MQNGNAFDLYLILGKVVEDFQLQKPANEHVDEPSNYHFNTLDKDHDLRETTIKASKITLNDAVNSDEEKCNNTAITSSGVVHVHQLYDKPLTQFAPELEIQVKVQFLLRDIIIFDKLINRLN